jgi:nucleosome binding factor SPN SPT16 subunit
MKKKQKQVQAYKKPNTRPIPILVTLAAAGISSVVSILKDVSFGRFVINLLITVIIFGIFGSLVRVFLDMGFNIDKKEEEQKNQESDEENVDEDEESSDKESDEEQTQE